MSRTGTGQALIGSLYLLRFVFYATLIFIVAEISTPIQWMKALFFAGTIFSTIGIIQFFYYPDLRNLQYLGWDPHYYRLFSTLLDPNFAGIFIVLTILLGFMMIKISVAKLLVIILQLINMGALILTVSRSSIVAAMVGILVITIRVRRWLLLIVLAIIIVGVVLIKSPTGTTIYSQLRFESAHARIENWQLSFNLIKKAPIIGQGWYMVSPAVPTQTRAYGVLDSSLLFVWATTGTIGICAFFWLLITFYRSAFAIMQRKDYMLLGLVYVSALSAIIVHSFFVNSLLYPFILIWLCIMTGIVQKSTSRR